MLVKFDYSREHTAVSSDRAVSSNRSKLAPCFVAAPLSIIPFDRRLSAGLRAADSGRLHIRPYF